MIKEKLRTFIIDNSDINVISRASSYFPHLISSRENTFLFECNGSKVDPYDVFVDISNYFSIKTSCSCPYKGPGICKHEVASIKYLIELIKYGKVELAPKVERVPFVSTITYIPHNKGVVDMEELNKMEFTNRSHYYSPMVFTSINKNKIEGVYDDFRTELELSLIYDRKEDKLSLKCSCKSPYPCAHKTVFLKTFFKRFGRDYFTENFEERFKQRTMEASKFYGKVDFDEIYELEISTDGVKVKERISNVVATDDAIFEIFKEDRRDFFLPDLQEDKSEYGVGIGIEKYKNQIVEVFPFSGKLDKSKSKLTTKFRAIDEDNLTESLSIVKDTNYQTLITKGIQLSHLYGQEANSDFSLENVKRMIHIFSSIVDSHPYQPIYLHKSRKTLVKKHTKELIVRDVGIVPVLKIINKKSFYQLDFKLKIENHTYGVASSKLLFTPFGIVLNDSFYVLKNPEIAYSLLRVISKPQLNIINNGLEDLRMKIIEPFSKVFEIEFSGIKSAKTDEKSDVEMHVYLSDEDGDFVVFQPLVQYGETLVTPESNEKVWADKSNMTYIERDEVLESNFLERFKCLHPKFEYQSNYFYLTVDEALHSMWLMDVIDQFKDEGIRVFGLNNLQSIRYNLNKPTFSIGLSSGTDWFDMSIDVSFGGQTVDLRQIQKSIVKQSNYVELKDGSIGILPKEWIEKYKKYFKLGQVKKDKIEISNFQFNIIDELYEQETNTPKFLQELYEKKKRLVNLKELKPIPKPKGINATLRDYQKEGLNWLVFLHENKLGGCLADDMGLGKTIQTIAFFQYLKNLENKESALPHLVVAPTSLMFNWLAELEKFAPGLKVLRFIGPNRNELIIQIPNHDVVLTTYGSIIKDIETHQEIEYNYVVLDESQAIKNPQSQRFKAVRLLNCKNRLALTGTPIENNTFDLYSQFSFLNPGIFGSIKHFKSTFSEAIDKDQDEYTSDLLARMINPFLLRRTKAQVAKELPTKTEVVIYCEMGKAQRKVYDHFKDHFRQKLQDQIKEEGINKSQMYILQGLTKLRQICNSTALADKEKDYGNESTKLDELVRHLTERVSNHKILVFSQFVGMLHLVRERLELEGILFEYLDGQTRNREERVNNFQDNDKIRVFLISLKAGGTGLNLTEADYVYLIDPWWNPAVESQAIDRCYRIGQDKKVMAYRMICKDTIEEKIVQLQDKKKTVAADIIRVDTEKKSFDKKDVEMFFGF